MDPEDASVSSLPSVGPAQQSAATTVAPAPLSRSVSQQSGTSNRSRRSVRGHNGGAGSRRASSRVSHGSQNAPQPPITSGSSIASEDSKSLTSFPSFSPKASSSSPPPPPPPPLSPSRAASRPRVGGRASSTTSLVDSLLSQPQSHPQSQPGAPTSTAPHTTASSATTAARSALFDDAPPLPSTRGLVPGALHLVDDVHIARLIGKHGAVALVRQLAEDLALRDAQMAALQARAADRERHLRKIAVECGLSSLDLETRLRTLEQEQEARLGAQQQQQQQQAVVPEDATSSTTHRRVSNLVSDAMADDHSLHRQASSSDYYYNDATIRASSRSSRASDKGATSNHNGDGSSSSSSNSIIIRNNTGTGKGWKDYLWGGNTAKRKNYPSSANDDVATLAAASAPSLAKQQQKQQQQPPSTRGDARPPITDELFQPPLRTEADFVRSASRASSMHSAALPATTQATRKPSLASMALRLVVGGSGESTEDAKKTNTTRGRAETTSGTLSPTAAAVSLGAAAAPAARGRKASMPPTAAARRPSGALPTPAGGPKTLMARRRATLTAASNGAAPRNISGGAGGVGGSTGAALHARGQPAERWGGEMLESSPATEGLARQENYGPVEMDTILPLDVQPPTLTHMYNHYNSSGYLIDRFGFIYDQRRKKRQREAAEMARHVKRGGGRSHAAMLTTGRSRRSAQLSSPARLLNSAANKAYGNDDVDVDVDRGSNGNSHKGQFEGDDRNGSDSGSLAGKVQPTVGGTVQEGPSSIVVADDDARSASPAVSMEDDLLARDAAATDSKEGGPKRWQDYLKIATFPTELLSHTPAMSDARIEVIAESDGGDDAKSTGGASADTGPKSPAFIASDGRGLVPPTSGAMAAATTATTTTSTAFSGLDTDSLASGTSNAVSDDTPPHLPPPVAAAAAEANAEAQASAKLHNPQKAQSQNSSATTLVQEDDEPVRLLLQQLSELHDALQKDRTVRWNEFLRKVRAERRREGAVVAAAAAGAGGGETRLLRATAFMPETRLADGEIIGVAGLGNKGKLGRAKWSEFCSLVLGGIPVVLRAKVWAECTGATSLRVPGVYEDLVAGRHHTHSQDSGNGNGNGGGNGHGGGNDSHDDDGLPADVVAQIQADIHRTLRDNIFFREGPGTAKLNEVLRAYARRNPDVGYCQGMNLIAANLLLVTPSAEDAFWLLASIVETLLPAGYYDHSLAASRADQQVLRRYVADVLPQLSAHFDALAIDLETMTFQWFLSLFTDCLSAEALFRVWDVVFCRGDGSVFLFQVALALLKLNEAALLRGCPTPAAVYTYINHQMTNHAISIDGLIQASEALRKLVRREDVEARRAEAMAAERAHAEARAAAVESAHAARKQQQQQQQQQQKQTETQTALAAAVAQSVVGSSDAEHHVKATTTSSGHPETAPKDAMAVSSGAEGVGDT
ncbi:tbc domain protein [Niveomyces insectorum RCEF 264]|uniref:Tbc domain protein n=1 Tax=Niveomyces insectorum RCEF 264 TaxID=1081102 RepID=A0A167NT24_9HYPO|nr:tbc domain protein [Niveomyces insectorum RCEF 264]